MRAIYAPLAMCRQIAADVHTFRLVSPCRGSSLPKCLAAPSAAPPSTTEPIVLRAGPSTLLDVPSGNSSPVHISSSQHPKLNIDNSRLAVMTVKELAGLIIDSGYTPTGEEYKKFNDKKILLGICRRLRGD